MLKDFSWILFLTPFAFGSGVVSLVLVAYAVFSRFDGGKSGRVYHEVY